MRIIETRQDPHPGDPARCSTPRDDHWLDWPPQRSVRRAEWPAVRCDVKPGTGEPVRQAREEGLLWCWTMRRGEYVHRVRVKPTKTLVGSFVSVMTPVVEDEDVVAVVVVVVRRETATVGQLRR